MRGYDEFKSILLNNSPNPILVINPDNAIEYANRALTELTGFSHAELIGKKPPFPWWGHKDNDNLNKQAIAISKGNYQTPAQVTEANKQLAAIKQQSDDVQKLIEQEYDKYTEYIKDNKDNQAFLNKLSRNYGTIPIIVNNIKASAVDMGLGVDTSALRRFAPLFVETVEKWRKIVADICAGKEPEPFTLTLPGQKPPPDMQKPSGGPEGYVKV